MTSPVQPALPLSWGTELSDVISDDHSAYGFLSLNGSCPPDRGLRGIRETSQGAWLQSRDSSYARSLSEEYFNSSLVMNDILKVALDASGHLQTFVVNYAIAEQAKLKSYDISSYSGVASRPQTTASIRAIREEVQAKWTENPAGLTKKEREFNDLRGSYNNFSNIEINGGWYNMVEPLDLTKVVVRPAFVGYRAEPIDDLANRVITDFGFYLGSYTRDDEEGRKSTGRLWIHTEYTQDVNDGGYNIDMASSWFGIKFGPAADHCIVVVKYEEMKHISHFLTMPWVIWSAFCGPCRQDGVFKRLQSNLVDWFARNLTFRYFGPVFSYWTHLWMSVYSIGFRRSQGTNSFTETKLIRMLNQLLIQRSKPAFLSGVIHDMLFMWEWNGPATSSGSIPEDLKNFGISGGFFKNLWKAIESESFQILDQMDIPPDPEWGVIDLEGMDSADFNKNLGHNGPIGLLSYILGMSFYGYKLLKLFDDINIIHAISAHISKLSKDTIKGYWVGFECGNLNKDFVSAASKCAFPKTKIWDMVIKEDIFLFDPDNPGFHLMDALHLGSKLHTFNAGIGQDLVSMVNTLDSKEPEWPTMIETRRVKNRKDFHDEVVKVYNAVKFKPTPIDLTISYPFMPSHRVPVPGTTYELVAAKDTNEIREWGQKQGHCVGSYADRVANAETTILGIWDKKTNDWVAHIQLNPVPATVRTYERAILNDSFIDRAKSNMPLIDTNTGNGKGYFDATSNSYRLVLPLVLSLGAWGGYKSPNSNHFTPIKVGNKSFTHSLDKVTGTANEDLQRRIAKVISNFAEHTSPLDFMDPAVCARLFALGVMGVRGQEMKFEISWNLTEIRVHQFYGKHNSAVDDKLSKDVSLALGDLIARSYMPKRLQDMIDREISDYLEEVLNKYVAVPKATFFTGFDTSSEIATGTRIR